MVVPRLVAAGDVGQVDFEREGHQLGDHLGAEPFFPPNFSAAGNCSTQLSTTANFLPGLALMLIVIILQNEQLSSPRAESARAVTGRRCPDSGRGEDFLSRQPDFFTETAVTPERKVEKSFPRWEINRHVEG